MHILATKLVSPRPFSSRATSHGRKYESVAVERFESLYGATRECGLFVHNDYPCLAASPDRVVDDHVIVEVKCPFASKDSNISPLTVPYLKMVDGELALSPSHDYYFQVQGQLACSERKFCYFCIYTLSDFKVVKIEKDEVFINDMMSKLRSFCEDHFLEAVMGRYVYNFFGKYF